MRRRGNWHKLAAILMSAALVGGALSPAQTVFAGGKDFVQYTEDPNGSESPAEETSENKVEKPENQTDIQEEVVDPIEDNSADKQKTSEEELKSDIVKDKDKVDESAPNGDLEQESDKGKSAEPKEVKKNKVQNQNIDSRNIDSEGADTSEIDEKLEKLDEQIQEYADELSKKAIDEAKEQKLTEEEASEAGQKAKDSFLQAIEKSGADAAEQAKKKVREDNQDLSDAEIAKLEEKAAKEAAYNAKEQFLADAKAKENVDKPKATDDKAKLPEKKGIKLEATLSTNGTKDQSEAQSVVLTEDGASFEKPIWYFDDMTLTVDAEFGAGTDKTIEVTLPDGMSFYSDGFNNQVYVVDGTDVTLKDKITSDDSRQEAGKKTDVIAGIKQYNGTMTLKFHGDGEDNDAKNVSIKIPVHTNAKVNYNHELYESGIAWFIDEIDDAVVVSQSYIPVDKNKRVDNNKREENVAKLSHLSIKNDERFLYEKTWDDTKFLPEVDLDEVSSGNEGFNVKPIPGGVPYTKGTVFKKFQITYLVPEGVEFVSFNDKPDLNGNYNGAKVVENEAGTKTAGNYLVPDGMKAYTWTIEDPKGILISPKTLVVYPKWKASSDYFDYEENGEFTVTVADLHVQYYGRDHEESLDLSKLPAQKYIITPKKEEVFINVFYNDKDRYVSGKITDTTVDLGAPGYEHDQERSIGYFTIGNRGLGNSVPKTVTITYDVNGINAFGILQQELPNMNREDVTISDIQYKTWNSKDPNGGESGWLDVSDDVVTTIKKRTPSKLDQRTSNSKLHLGDLGIDVDSGTYFKAIRYNISTIPHQQYLRNEKMSGSDTTYPYIGRVLTNKEYTLKVEENNKTVITTPIMDEMEISDQNGDRSVKGYNYTGTSGLSAIQASCWYYGAKGWGNYSPVEVGKGPQKVVTGAFTHASTPANKEDLKAIYLISPYGEDYTDITVVTSGNQISKKIHTNAVRSEVLKLNEKSASGILLTEVNNDVIQNNSNYAGLKSKYPEAKFYKIDFTGVKNNQQDIYDFRRVNASVIGGSETYRYRDWDTTSQYDGVKIEFQYAPKISDEPGSYTDLTWAEFVDDSKNIVYRASSFCTWYKDDFGLTGSNDPNKRISKMSEMTLLPSEGLEVTSAVKQRNEGQEWYRVYDENDKNTILGVYSDLNYKLTVKNESSLAATGWTAYWAVPKSGEEWGNLSPKGAFKYSLTLSNALRVVPEGYKVYYAKNVTPSIKYQDWDEPTGSEWVPQSDTEDWSVTDWNEVNFVKIDWVGKEDHPAIKGGESAQFEFDLRVDTASQISKEQMNTIDYWAPYFLRGYSNSSSFKAGQTAAAVLTPGKVEGVIWDDVNYDGIRDQDEVGISNVTVKLYDTSTGSDKLRVITTTDADGKYLFDGIKDGTPESGQDLWKVVVTRPDSYIDFTRPGDDMAFKDVYLGDEKMRFVVASANQQHEEPKKAPRRLFALFAAPVAEEEASATTEAGKSYDAGMIASVPVTLPNLVKKIDGRNKEDLNNTAFEFVLQSDDPNAPMPEGAVQTEDAKTAREIIRGEGEKAEPFGVIRVTKEKLKNPYSYKVSETRGNVRGVTYDTTTYALTLRVDKDQENGIWQGSYTLTKENDTQEGRILKTMEFSNGYTRPVDPTPDDPTPDNPDPENPTPTPAPTQPRPADNGVLGAARLPEAIQQLADDVQQVLGAERPLEEAGKVLGARRAARTGDESNLILYGAAICAAFAGLCFWAKKKRKNVK